jgi:hypothetical protein
MTNLFRLPRGKMLDCIGQYIRQSRHLEAWRSGQVEVLGIFTGAESPYLCCRVIQPRDGGMRRRRRYCAIFLNRPIPGVIFNWKPHWDTWEAGTGDRPAVYERVVRYVKQRRPVKVIYCPLCTPSVELKRVAGGYKCPECKSFLQERT